MIKILITMQRAVYNFYEIHCLHSIQIAMEFLARFKQMATCYNVCPRSDKRKHVRPAGSAGGGEGEKSQWINHTVMTSNM